jgi:hypothetical protein
MHASLYYEYGMMLCINKVPKYAHVFFGRFFFWMNYDSHILEILVLERPSDLFPSAFLLLCLIYA